MSGARPLSPATHEWWGYQRPAEFEVVGVTVEVPMRDGITLSCSLRRPARDGVPIDGRFPGLVVEFTPYVVLADFYAGEADFFVGPRLHRARRDDARRRQLGRPVGARQLPAGRP